MVVPESKLMTYVSLESLIRGKLGSVAAVATLGDV